MLIGVAMATVAALIVAGILVAAGLVAPAVAAHVAFAIGIVPLILAAMTHFVPVLTRTGGSAGPVRYFPLVAQGGGLLAVLAMHGTLPHAFLHMAAAVDLVLALWLAVWIRARARACLGAPHPGWRWYGMALIALSLALFCILLMPLFPAAHLALRLGHLHLNVLGLVGLAAFGTLPVLLPTALGRPDRAATQWLVVRLRWLGGGALAGAAAGMASVTAFDFLVSPLAALAAALLLVPALVLAIQWVRGFGLQALRTDGASASLLAAVIGWGVLVVSGFGHALGFWPARPAIAGFAVGFLLPLVTGALTQLLPVWRYPGVTRPERLAMRQRLARTGVWRAFLFVLAGGLVALQVPIAGPLLALFGLLIFIVALFQSWRA